ncbi:hypothetical protein [Larkinella soli]|uniref:hypothetical protein n=1 Tax=Larkinella soli TaxID=1770527 RepID=UPI000FFBF643|nr:hypothetical protein [Larkinella soli]
MKHRFTFHLPFRRLVVPFLLLLGPACRQNAEEEPDRQVQALRPVYATYEEVATIKTLGPQPLKSPGKIYVKDRYLFINEQGKGVHVIDNADPARPRKLSFISVPGNVDMAVKGTILYVDNTVDLVALDISDPAQVKVVKRIKNAYPNPSYPQERGVQFECADPARGIVVRWETAMVSNPKCYR